MLSDWLYFRGMKKMYRNLVLVSLLFLITLPGRALGQAPDDSVKIVFYNLLRFPGSTPTRADSLEVIIDYIQPDILGVCEVNNASGADMVLTDALEDLDPDWAAAPYVDGPDTDAMLYFKESQWGIDLVIEIPTALRSAMFYRVYYKDPNLAQHQDTTYLNFVLAHLKAGSDNSDETQRDQEAAAIRNFLNTAELKGGLVAMGDWNLKRSSEPAYATLLNGSSYTLLDPINRPGDWNANPSFADIHTQSTRTSQFGGGATGGLDDRFDIVLNSDSVQAGLGRWEYVDNSYLAVGNDGQHFNDALIDPPLNTSVPYPVLTALYHMSDHLPVEMDLAVTLPAPAALANPSPAALSLRVHATPDYLKVFPGNWQNGKFSATLLDVNGRIVQQWQPTHQNGTFAHRLPLSGTMAGGVYILRVQQQGSVGHQRVVLR